MSQSSVAETLIRTIEASDLFDADWYKRANPDVAHSGMGAAEHFLKIGLGLNRDPSAASNSKDYLAQNPAVAERLQELSLIGNAAQRRAEAPSVPSKPDQPVARQLRRAPLRPPPEAAPLGQRERVDVVVPVYNALDDVKLCLQALARCETRFDQRILVVNDGSEPETGRWLRQACADLGHMHLSFKLIEHKTNQGYTKAVNSGLKASDAPYVVTLNSDTIVTPFWLDGLVRCMHSAPEIGITGPMSNAASWQNVPDLLNADKKFAINELPRGMSPDAMAEIVRQASARSYPRSPFVNGFCFMIRRAVLDAIGLLDEEAFPKGYGEENDLCIRAQDAGFALAYADDTYVFHAKSRSFGSAQRDALSKAGGAALRAKHTEQKFKRLEALVRETDAMDAVRARVRQQLHQAMDPASTGGTDWVMKQRILFLLPVKGGSGGAHSVVQEVTAMRAMGVQARIAVRDKHLDDFFRLYGDIEGVEDIFAGFGDGSVTALASGYDVLVGTIFTSMELVRDVVAQCPWVMPAYYAQDYEPLFFDDDPKMRQQALDSYDLIPGTVVFAKTDWIRETIQASHTARVHKVSPSIDHTIYHPAPVNRPQGAPLVITAMIRPRTPRRGAGRTMQLLMQMKAHYGPRIEIRIFGADDASPEFQSLNRDFDYENLGILTRPEVAELLQQADMFIDLSDYQAFGRTGLEAMACGTIAVVPKAGGGDEYAIDGENALVVDTMDVEAAFARIRQLLDDPAPIADMQLAALQTAAGYSPRRAAMSELVVLAQARAAYFGQG